MQHLISRFVNREFLFDAPGARDEYLSRAARSFARCDWTPVGYALMSSHVHWIAVAGSAPSDILMRSLHGGFSGWLNRSTGRIGPVFADRHRNVECESQTAIAMLAYIHNNPVRARVVADAGISPWTSHRAYIGVEPAPKWLGVELGLSLCGLEPSPAGRRAFDHYVTERAHQARQPELVAANLQHALCDARRLAALPVEPASPHIVCDLQWPDRLTQRIDWFVPALSPERLRGASPLVVLQAVASSNAVTEHELRSGSRSHRISRVRRQAMLAWTLGLARPAVEMARALGIAGTTGSSLISRSSRMEREQAVDLAQTLYGSTPQTEVEGRTVEPAKCKNA